MRPSALAGGLVLAVIALGGCYAGKSQPFSPAAFEREPGWLSVPSVPTLRQKGQRDCGVAVAAMLLGYWGLPATQVELRAASKLPPERGLPAGLLRALLRERGLDAFLLEGTFADLERELSGGRPVVVGVIKPYSNDKAYAHYQVVVGMHPGKQRLVVIDPADGWRVYSFEAFLKEWQPTRHLTIVALPPA